MVNVSYTIGTIPIPYSYSKGMCESVARGFFEIKLGTSFLDRVSI